MAAVRSPFLVLALLFLVSPSLTACVSSTSAPGPDFRKAEEDYFTKISDLSTAGLAEGQALRVVATTDVVGDVVGSVAGEVVALSVLFTRGADPHAYQATPRDLRALEEAHLVFVNGFGLEEALLETLEGAAKGVPVVSISEGLEGRRFAEPPPGETGKAPQPAGKSQGEVDPHVWFDPTNVVVWANNAARALVARDPLNAAAYLTNATQYEAELKELDAWIQERLSVLPPGGRVLVADHDALGYFADRYGFEIVGAVVPAYSTTAEPSAQQIADLQAAINRFGVKAVFVGGTVNPGLTERLAQDTGIALVPLFTGSLGQADGPAGTYQDFMRYNVTAIVEALK